MTALLVALGGAVGAVLRHLVVRATAALPGAPASGTLLVNVVGSLLLGMVAAAAARSSPWWALIGLGVCGALTTFSSHALQVVQAARAGALRAAVADLGLSVTLGGAAVSLGWALATST